MVTVTYINQLVKQKYTNIVKRYMRAVEVKDPWYLLANLAKLDCLEQGWQMSLDRYLETEFGVRYKQESVEEGASMSCDYEYNIFGDTESTELVMPAKDRDIKQLRMLKFDNVSQIHYILPYNRYDFETDIRLITDVILQDASELRASDIHFQTVSEFDNSFTYEVSFRLGIPLVRQDKYVVDKALVDGIIKDILYNRSAVEHKYAELANLSGLRFRLIDEDFPARCQVAKSIGGKTLTVRMFYFDSAPRIEELGFNSESQRMLESVSNQTSGLTLVSGVFGSGKGTTLNAVGMRMEEKGALAMASLDDPIEYLRRYPQYEYNSQHQLEEYIEAFKKMDLNVVYLNEIITRTVGDAVFNLVSSGIHILSTIHTNRVYRIMYKIQEMFGPHYLNLIPFINVLTFQDKFSVCCPHCRVGIAKDGYADDSDEVKLLNYLGLETFYQPRGCSECNHGVVPRGIRVFSEHVVFNDTVKEALLKRDVHQQFEYLKQVVEEGNSMEKEIRQALIDGEILIAEALIKLDSWG